MKGQLPKEMQRTLIFQRRWKSGAADQWEGSEIKFIMVGKMFERTFAERKFDVPSAISLLP
jgi:hypothetical protein